MLWLQGSGLMASFELQEDAVACFLRAIEDGYQDNPYHSRTHAAGVTLQDTIHKTTRMPYYSKDNLAPPSPLLCL